MLKPKVGDIVIIEGIVASTDGANFKMRTLFRDYPYRDQGYVDFGSSISIARIKEIISPPIKVGDTVRKKDDDCITFDYTVLAVHGPDTPLVTPYGPTRRWAVCAHGDDIPIIFNVSQIVCVD